MAKYDAKRALSELADESLGSRVRIQGYFHEAKLGPRDKALLKEAASQAIDKARTNREAVREIIEWVRIAAKAAAKA